MKIPFKLDCSITKSNLTKSNLSLCQPTLPPMPTVNEPRKEVNMVNINDINKLKTFSEVTIDNDHNLTAKDRYMPVLYNEKPIGFVNIVTPEKLTILIWNKYLDFVPEFSFMDQYVESKCVVDVKDKNVLNYKMVIKDKEHYFKEDTVGSYKQRIKKCFDQLLPYICFYTDSDKESEFDFNELLNDVLDENYKTIEENMKIKLEV